MQVRFLKLELIQPLVSCTLRYRCAGNVNQRLAGVAIEDFSRGHDTKKIFRTRSVFRVFASAIFSLPSFSMSPDAPLVFQCARALVVFVAADSKSLFAVSDKRVKGKQQMLYRVCQGRLPSSDSKLAPQYQSLP